MKTMKRKPQQIKLRWTQLDDRQLPYGFEQRWRSGDYLIVRATVYGHRLECVCWRIVPDESEQMLFGETTEQRIGEKRSLSGAKKLCQQHLTLSEK